MMRSMRWITMGILTAGMAAIALPGCGGKPESGTQVSPVNEEEAQKQNEAMRNFYQAQGKTNAAPKQP